MSTQKKIKSLQLKNFRSYREETFNIDEHTNLILLYGNNGLGKTAFFDAIEWGLTGNLKRYDNPSKEKNEYPVLSNIFKKSNEKSFVNMVFNDNTYILRHVSKKGCGDFNSGIIHSEFDINEEMVHDYYKKSVTFSSNFAFSQFLSQELINSFIRSDKDTDRYNSVVSLFGLSRYTQYQSFIREMLTNIKQRKAFLDSKLLRVNGAINKEKSNCSEINIDIKLKCQELNNIVVDKINFDDENGILSALKKIKSESFTIKDEYEKKIDKYKRYIVDLKDLDNIFDEKEEAITLIEVYKRNGEITKSYIDKLEKHNKIFYVFKNIDKYAKYKESEIKLVGLEKEYVENLEIYEELQKSYGNIDREINIINEKFNSNNILVQEYNKLMKHIRKSKDELRYLEERLKEKSSMKQQFLRITTNYLKDNIELNQCPVCQNNFNINDTLNRLSEEVDKESNEFFLDIKSKIDKYNEIITNDNKKLQKTVSSIDNKIKELATDYSKRLFSMNTEIQSLRLTKEIYVKVKNYLEDLDINESEIKIHYEAILEKINELCINEDIEYYKFKYKDIMDKHNTISKQVSQYISDKQKYKIKEKEDIKLHINKCNEAVEKCNTLIGTHSKIIKICEEINTYYNSYFSQNRINDLVQELKQLQREYNALNFIEQEFNKLDKNSRNIIETQTKTILSTYQDTIKKIYKYLNPNLKFDDFNFKIDDNNPRNNRMVLEVTGTNGYKMSPAYSFSSAQNNVLAISIFLSFALTQRWSNLNCIFMDDPIQNMDDINISNFIDILRNIIKKTNKQIFISTHDERIYNFIKNKFKANIQTFEFEDYGKIKTEIIR